jgi:hypothetical protein
MMGRLPAAKQAAEKPNGWAFLDISARQGLKPDPLLSTVCGTTKVVPCYKASRNWVIQEFFRSL